MQVLQEKYLQGLQISCKMVLLGWLGLHTIIRGYSSTLPLWYIDATAFNSTSQHLVITAHFAVYLLLSGFHSALLNPPWISDILYLLVLFKTHSQVRLYCIQLDIEILFQNLTLQISDFWSPLVVSWSVYQQFSIQHFHSAQLINDEGIFCFACYSTSK